MAAPAFTLAIYSAAIASLPRGVGLYGLPGNDIEESHVTVIISLFMALLRTLSRTVGSEFPFASHRREFRLAATLSPTKTHAGDYTGHSQYSPKGGSKLPIKDSLAFPNNSLAQASKRLA